MDPTNLWLVWDKYTDQPAEMDGDVLIGLEEDEAKACCRTLNRLSISSGDKERLAS